MNTENSGINSKHSKQKTVTERMESKLHKDKELEEYFNNPIKEEDEELNSRSMRGSEFKSQKSSKSEIEISRKNSRKSGEGSVFGGDSIDGGDMKNGSFSRHDSGASSKDSIDFDVTRQVSSRSKLECPKSTIGKIFFIIFFPTFFIFWLTMPNIKVNPNISKVMLISILMFFFSAIFGYLIYQLEANIILAWQLKTEIVGLINGFLLSIGYVIIPLNYLGIWSTVSRLQLQNSIILSLHRNSLFLNLAF